MLSFVGVNQPRQRVVSAISAEGAFGESVLECFTTNTWRLAVLLTEGKAAFEIIVDFFPVVRHDFVRNLLRNPGEGVPMC